MFPQPLNECVHANSKQNISTPQRPPFPSQRLATAFQ
jgi:hypothetical protein